LLGGSRLAFGLPDEPCWIFGNVSTVPTETEYMNATHYQFNFTVASSNASWITVYPLELTVYAPLTMMANIVLSKGQNLNLTGYTDTNGFFIVTQVNDLGGMEWIETLKALWTMIGEVGKTLVTLIVQVVEAFSGVQLPSWTVSLILVALMSFMFIRLGTKLPWIFLVIMFFVCVALISHLITSLQLFFY
jgi:hypothetical protein